MELGRRAIEVIGRGLYLVEVSSGAAVPGEVREGVVRMDGAVVPGWPDGDVVGVVSFVPDEPLEEGWYVLVADLREWMTSNARVTRLDGAIGFVEDDMVFARFRIGSEPTWFRTQVHCDTRQLGHERTTWCDIMVALSEPADLGSTRFELRVDGELDPGCVQTVAGAWTCPHYPDGTEFEVQLVESEIVRPLDGIATQSIVGGGQSAQVALVSPRFGIEVARSAR